jgi:AraC-like DNA-binding protein
LAHQVHPADYRLGGCFGWYLIDPVGPLADHSLAQHPHRVEPRHVRPEHAGTHRVRGVDTTTGVGAAARHALTALADNHLAEGTAIRLAAHTSGLLAIAVQQPAEPMPRSARGRLAVLADLEKHLGDADLSPATTARRLGISVRQLHALFAGHDRSFAAEVRRRRLEVARRDLMDPARSHLRVIDISVEAGFVNVASFHRAFRRQFGQTPAQVRAAALGPQ